MKTADGQIVVSSSQSQDIYDELKDIQSHILSLSGAVSNWPSVATLSRPTLARILNLNSLYDLIIGRTGVICEFGVHYGSSLATLLNLRSIKEPYNYSRTLFGFDTFEGFVGSKSEDGTAVKDGDFKLGQSYEKLLERLLTLHEKLSPNAHIKKFQIYKGNAGETVRAWLEEHPYALVAMAIFDMDIYKPTKDVLEAILPRLTKGSVLVFDELNCQHFPGETLALMEVLDIHKLKLMQSPLLPFTSYTVFGE